MKRTLLPILVSIIIVLLFIFKFITVNNPSLPQSPFPTLTPTPRLEPLAVRTSIPYWDQRRAFSSFTQNVSVFKHLSLFWYFLDMEGTIQKYQYADEDKSIIDFARSNNVEVTAVITNLPETPRTSWDSSRVEDMLEVEEKRSAHIEDILNLLSNLDFDGVTIDYEEVNPDARNNFTFFISELASELHNQGKKLWIALHPKLGNSSDHRYAFQDWPALSKSADYLYIMAYGEHYDEGSPGPIASISWVKKIVEYTRKQNLPLNKFYLGIPLYGYDWQENEEKATGLTYEQIENLRQDYGAMRLWDEDSQSPHFSYEDDGHTHEVWYEDRASVAAKVALADRAGFAGVTFWRLGSEDPSVWQLFN